MATLPMCCFLFNIYLDTYRILTNHNGHFNQRTKITQQCRSYLTGKDLVTFPRFRKSGGYQGEFLI
jgi:hypothetical protein